MREVYLKNFLVWSEDTTDPTRFPAVRVTLPEPLPSREEKWIVVGRWRLKVVVEPNQRGGFTLHGKGGAKLDMQADSGTMFVDDRFLT